MTVTGLWVRVNWLELENEDDEDGDYDEGMKVKVEDGDLVAILAGEMGYGSREDCSAQQKDDGKTLNRWRWGFVLMDEAHELWSLLEFMMSDIFGTGDVDLKKLLNVEDHKLILHIKSILGPFILRHLKLDVMHQLVPKIQHVFNFVILDSEQSQAYSHARSAKSTFKFSNNVIANHPLLIRNIYSDKDTDRILLISDGDSGTKGALIDEHVLGSAKCQALAELLPSLANDGHRVVIFSQWMTMLDILEWTQEVIGVTYRHLDGRRIGKLKIVVIALDNINLSLSIGNRLVTKASVDENIYEIARRKLVLDATILRSGAELDDSTDAPEKTMGEILASLHLV
ncbi:hypothetical protein ABZP36_003581 [Zizania latifolia]